MRELLFGLQRDFYDGGGLVADGRDMGTVVFKDAKLKIFLTASPEVRAKRRYLELQKRGQEVNMPALIDDIEQRDLKDTSRELSPLLPADDAHIIDSSEMSLEEVFEIFSLPLKIGMFIVIPASLAPIQNLPLNFSLFPSLCSNN